MTLALTLSVAVSTTPSLPPLTGSLGSETAWSVVTGRWTAVGVAGCEAGTAASRDVSMVPLMKGRIGEREKENLPFSWGASVAAATLTLAAWRPVLARGSPLTWRTVVAWSAVTAWAALAWTTWCAGGRCAAGKAAGEAACGCYACGGGAAGTTWAAADGVGGLTRSAGSVGLACWCCGAWWAVGDGEGGGDEAGCEEGRDGDELHVGGCVIWG